MMMKRDLSIAESEPWERVQDHTAVTDSTGETDKEQSGGKK